jgi:hypothetical protein
LWIRLGFVYALSISDRRTNDMDVKPHVHALVQLAALRFVAFLHRPLAVLVSDATLLGKRKKEELGILLPNPFLIWVQARVVLRASTT